MPRICPDPLVPSVCAVDDEKLALAHFAFAIGIRDRGHVSGAQAASRNSPVELLQHVAPQPAIELGQPVHNSQRVATELGAVTQDRGKRLSEPLRGFVGSAYESAGARSSALSRPLSANSRPSRP